MEDSEVEQRHRARPRPHLFPGLRRGRGAVLRREGAGRSCTPGSTKTWTDFKVPDEAIGCGFHEAVRGVLSHHVVIRDGKIANYHPYPPTPWNANPRDIYGTPGPYEDAVQNTPIFEENGPDKFKGIDIMRAVRSFDPCLPCGVHMYLGDGKDAGDAPFADVRTAIVTGSHAGEPIECQHNTRSSGGSNRSRSCFTRSSRPPTRACATTANELVQLVMELHGAGLERMLEIVRRGRASRARQIIDTAGRATIWYRVFSCCTGFIRSIWKPGLREALEKVRAQAEMWNC